LVLSQLFDKMMGREIATVEDARQMLGLVEQR
jgi:hypothetical protein